MMGLTLGLKLVMLPGFSPGANLRESEPGERIAVLALFEPGEIALAAWRGWTIADGRASAAISSLRSEAANPGGTVVVKGLKVLVGACRGLTAGALDARAAISPARSSAANPAGSVVVKGLKVDVDAWRAARIGFSTSVVS